MTNQLINPNASTEAGPSPANHLQKQGGRFKKGQSGNPASKRPGTRNRATALAEQMLDGEAEALMRKLIELANSGDTAALRLCVDRLLPPLRTRPMRMTFPPLRDPADAPNAIAAITAAATKGEISTNEAMDLVALVNAFLAAYDATHLVHRMGKLEQSEKDAA